jgi:hypothetical protein
MQDEQSKVQEDQRHPPQPQLHAQQRLNKRRLRLHFCLSERQEEIDRSIPWIKGDLMRTAAAMQ